MTGPVLRSSRRHDSIRRLCALGATAAVGTALSAAPAYAHTISPNFHTAITSVAPALPGVTVTAADDGNYVQLSNTSPTPVVVFGYEQEPYLRIGPTGVEENALSPATYLNESRQVGSIPANVDPKAAPSWRKIANGTTFEWHDHRVHWMDSALPPDVQAQPGKPHLVTDWTIPAIGARPFTVSGTLTWRPAPTSTTPTIVGGVAGFAVLAGGTALLARRRRDAQRASEAAAAGARRVPTPV